MTGYVETVVLLSKGKIDSKKVRMEFSLEDMDMSGFQKDATYEEEFCQYFQIPYRTVTEWERDNRHAPEHVLRLLEYYIRSENLGREVKEDDE